MTDLFPIRVGAKAIVLEDDAVLAVRIDDENSLHYNLPGGGIEPDERVRDGLVREVREETGATVSVGPLSFVNEYYPPAHDAEYGPTHMLNLFFSCELTGSTQPNLPVKPDPNQVGVEWLPVASIDDQPLAPELGETWNDVLDGEPSTRYVDRW